MDFADKYPRALPVNRTFDNVPMSTWNTGFTTAVSVTNTGTTTEPAAFTLNDNPCTT